MGVDIKNALSLNLHSCSSFTCTGISTIYESSNMFKQQSQSDLLFYLPLKLQCRSVSKNESFPGSRLESTSSSFRSLLFLDFPKDFCRQLLLLINWLGYSFKNIPVIVTLGGVPFNTHMCVCAVCKHFSIILSFKENTMHI